MTLSDDKDQSLYLKCRFCNFRVPKYRRLKDGRIRNGWNILNSHIEVEHPVKYEELLEWWDKYREDEGENAIGYDDIFEDIEE